jgi:hypothetical protein
MKRLSFYYPLIIFIFLVNYHFYSFYAGNFPKMKQLVSSKSNLNRYEAIQSEHPYYEIWKLSQDSKKNVTVIMDERNEGTIDYTTTYFKKKMGDKNNYYLSELTLFINYYFYPRKIKALTFYQAVMSKIKYQEGDYIISDYNFSFYDQGLSIPKNKTEKEKLFDSNFKTLYGRLKNIKISEKNYFMTNRRRETSYYIYQVIN